MATPSLTRHELDGVLGPLHVDVRAGGRATPRPAVVVIHGFKGFKDWGFFPSFAERVARAGMTAVTFNLSGSGVDAAGEPAHPERFARNTYGAELRDTATVIGALLRGELGTAPPSTLGLVGHSRGGGIALLHAVGDDQVHALVTWAGISRIDRWDEETRRRWRAEGSLEVVNARTGQRIPVGTALLDEAESGDDRFDIMAAAHRIDVPWMIVHGTADESVPVAEGERLAHAAGPELTTWLPVEGTGHTFGAAHPWNPPVPAVDLVFDATLQFLASALLRST
ncbi:MAG TPA: alpha/beta hydrolase [Gemmatimonadales bacterium]|nr:alpha/beta hydrolase [Gemmatimonadales bacterium]